MGVIALVGVVWTAIALTLVGLRGPILSLLYTVDMKLNHRAQARRQAHSESLAEWLRESPQDKTGR